jgi:hypothetical protein
MQELLRTKNLRCMLLSSEVEEVALHSILNRWHGVVLLGALLAGGCGSRLCYTPLVASPRPLFSKPVSEVQVIAVTAPTRTLMTLGMFQVIQGFDDETAATEIAQIRTDAARRGCDAILVTSVDNRMPQRLSVQAGCIVFTDANASAVPKAATAPKPANAPTVGPSQAP